MRAEAGLGASPSHSHYDSAIRGFIPATFQSQNNPLCHQVHWLLNMISGAQNLDEQSKEQVGSMAAMMDHHQMNWCQLRKILHERFRLFQQVSPLHVKNSQNHTSDCKTDPWSLRESLSKTQMWKTVIDASFLSSSGLQECPKLQSICLGVADSGVALLRIVTQHFVGFRNATWNHIVEEGTHFLNSSYFVKTSQNTVGQKDSSFQSEVKRLQFSTEDLYYTKMRKSRFMFINVY